MFHPDLHLDLFRQEQARRAARLADLATHPGPEATTRRARRRGRRAR